MNDLGVRAKAIVEAARDGDQPTPGDHDRIKRAVLVQIAAGTAIASTAAAGTLSIGVKVGLAVVAVSLAGGGAVGWMKLRAPSAPVAAVARAQATSTAAHKATPAPEASPPSMAEAPSALMPVDGKSHRAEKPRRAAGQGSREGDRRIEEDQLNAEVAVLKRAREELRLGRPARALEALVEYDRRFGKGALGEERQALSAIAACQAQPGPAARAEARAFIRAAPKSPLLDRVRAACITPGAADSP
jgi:hypothetical protein